MRSVTRQDKMKITDSQKELLVRVNEKNEVIGPIERGLAHKSKTTYRTIYVIVKDMEGKVLIQKRSRTKDLFPGCWDLSVGGHVNFGNSYAFTAIRELDEELGIKAREKELRYMGEVLVKLPLSSEFFWVYEYSLNEGQKIEFAREEVSEIKWMSMELIKKTMSEKSLNWYARPLQVVNSLY
jgi:isopentenyldiphosphate isomerase